MSIYINIIKKFKGFTLKINFEASNGATALFGASGSGKSMTLKCITGIETPDSGRIVINDIVVFDSENKINLPPQKRKVGYLFQNYALFPNMTVRENIACICDNPDAYVQRFGLDEIATKYPKELSGGQQQRTALARMFASNPQIIMLDEPFSALDTHLKHKMQKQVTEILQDFTGTVLFVSHNRDEVFRLCDNIVIIENGSNEPITHKDVLIKNPQTLSSAMLSGCENISPVEILGNNTVYATHWGIKLKVNQMYDYQYIGIHSHCIEYSEHSQENVYTAKVDSITSNNFSKTVHLRIGEGTLNWETNLSDISDNIKISLPKDKLIYIRR